MVIGGDDDDHHHPFDHWIVIFMYNNVEAEAETKVPYFLSEL